MSSSAPIRKQHQPQLVQILKSKSAKALFTTYPEITQFLWGGAVWSVGYYARTVSDGPLEHVIANYVQTQGQQRSTGAGHQDYQLRLVP